MNRTHENFPETRWSIILEARDDQTALRQRALEVICGAYWLPIYAYARGRGLEPADAEDLTQNLLAYLLQRGAFERVAEENGKLRTYLMVATRNYIANEWKKRVAQKRGGGVAVLSLDHENAEGRCALAARDDETPERTFERHWAINLLHRVMERLEATYVGEGKGEVFAALKDSLTPTSGGSEYTEIAATLGMKEGAVRTAVHRLRKRYRRILKEEISHTLDDPTKEAIDDEVRYLFGVFAR